MGSASYWWRHYVNPRKEIEAMENVVPIRLRDRLFAAGYNYEEIDTALDATAENPSFERAIHVMVINRIARLFKAPGFVYKGNFTFEWDPADIEE